MSGARRQADRAGGLCPEPQASQPEALIPRAAPGEWGLKLSEGVVELIREVGAYRLGGYDGCPCTSFEVQSVSVHVSCHKSDYSVRVHSHNVDYCDEKYALDTRLLQPIADEVLRQVAEGRGIEYADEMPIKFQTWEQEHGK